MCDRRLGLEPAPQCGGCLSGGRSNGHGPGWRPLGPDHIRCICCGEWEAAEHNHKMCLKCEGRS